MSQDELDTVTRIVVARASACVEDALTAMKCRYLGHPDAEGVIEEARQSIHDALLMLAEHPRP